MVPVPRRHEDIIAEASLMSLLVVGRGHVEIQARVRNWYGNRWRIRCRRRQAPLSLPTITPNHVLKNCMYVRFIRPVCSLRSPQERRDVHGRDGARGATHVSPNPLMAYPFKNPPGHRPSLLRVHVERVLGVAPELRLGVPPPARDALGDSNASTSNTTPFLPSSSRGPNQLPVSRAATRYRLPTSEERPRRALTGPVRMSRARPERIARRITEACRRRAAGPVCGTCQPDAKIPRSSAYTASRHTAVSRSAAATRAQGHRRQGQGGRDDKESPPSLNNVPRMPR